MGVGEVGREERVREGIKEGGRVGGIERGREGGKEGREEGVKEGGREGRRKRSMDAVMRLPLCRVISVEVVNCTIKDLQSHSQSRDFYVIYSTLIFLGQ